MTLKSLKRTVIAVFFLMVGYAQAQEKDLPPWFEVETKIAELSSKVASKKQSVEKLIEEKNKLPANSHQSNEIVKTLVREHKDLVTLTEEYNQKLNVLKYRFPERGASHNRQYRRLNVESLEDLEKTAGVDGKLSRNLQRVQKQLGGSETKKSTTPSKDQKEKTIEQEAPIILRK